MVYNLLVEVNRIAIYTSPIQVALILITNTLNILVLSRRSLRTSSCTHYFLALSIVSFVYMIFTPVHMFLTSRFGISLDSLPVGCRIHSFFVFSPLLFFIVMLVCASIDRFCSSSSSVRIRNFSNVRVAQRVIIIVTIVTTIYMSPFLIIYHWDYNTNLCSQYSTRLTAIYLSTRVILYYIIGPLAMITFGLLTINNIRNQIRRTAPMVPQSQHRRIEGQLARVLLIQIGIHLFFSLPAAVMYVMTTFLPSTNTPFFSGLRMISVIWQMAILFFSFFSYILWSTVFRIELIKMLKLNNRHNQIVHRFNFRQIHFRPHHVMDTRV